MPYEQFPGGRFYIGDCLGIMPEFRRHSISMVLCDLPYGTTKNKWDTVIPFPLLWKEYLRIGRKNAVYALTASQPFSSLLISSQISLFRHEWIWIKNKGSNFANTVREPFKEHESVMIFSAGKWTYNKQMQERTGAGEARVKYAISSTTKSSNYQEFKGVHHRALSKMRVPSSWQKFNTETGMHPTQKPVALFEYLIRTYTNPSDIVLDNCAGSGTTAIAAINAGRRWVCIEKDKDYASVAVERIRKHVERCKSGLFRR